MSESGDDWYIQRVTGRGGGGRSTLNSGLCGYLGLLVPLNRVSATCTSPIMHLICPNPPFPTQILHTLCFSFLLGITAVPREIENYAYAKFLEANKVHYGRCASGELRLFASLTLEQDIKITLYCWKKVISYFTLTLEQCRFFP